MIHLLIIKRCFPHEPNGYDCVSHDAIMQLFWDNIFLFSIMDLMLHGIVG